MQRICYCFALAVLVTASSSAVSVRYFLSLDGLSDPNDTESAAVMPTNIGVDPMIADATGGSYRLYLWAQIGPGDIPAFDVTDLKEVDLAFRTTGDVQITGGDIWQNTFVPPVSMRWNALEMPGDFSADGSGLFADPVRASAVLEAGVTNGNFSFFDDQWIAGNLNAAVIGSLDVATTGGVGEVHIINQHSDFLQLGERRAFLGWDDAVGAVADDPNSDYDNADWEARFIPEPSSGLIAVLLATLYARTRRA